MRSSSKLVVLLATISSVQICLAKTDTRTVSAPVNVTVTEICSLSRKYVTSYTTDSLDNTSTSSQNTTDTYTITLCAPESITTSTGADVGSTTDTLPIETESPSSSVVSVNSSTPSEPAVESTSTSSTNASEIQALITTSQATTTSSGTIEAESEHQLETSMPSTTLANPTLAIETSQLPELTVEAESKLASMTTSEPVSIASEIGFLIHNTSITAGPTTTTLQSDTSIESSTSSEQFPSLLFPANSTTDAVTPEETPEETPDMTELVLMRLARVRGASISEGGPGEDDEWALTIWWNNGVMILIYLFLYLPEEAWTDEFVTSLENLIIPDDYFLPWPPIDFLAEFLGVEVPLETLPDTVETETVETTIHTTQNGKPTDIVSSFTSLITEPPIAPSITTKLVTSSFTSWSNGQPIITSTVATRTFAIAASSTITSEGTSLLETVIDGTTTFVPVVFPVTVVTPGNTFRILGSVTTITTVISGTTEIFKRTLITGSLVAARTLEFVSGDSAGFTKTFDDDNGITYILTDGVTKTLAASGSIIDHAAFPMTTSSATRAGKAVPGTFVTEIASQTSGGGGGEQQTAALSGPEQTTVGGGGSASDKSAGSSVLVPYFGAFMVLGVISVHAFF
ncbi:hypothetical protein H072_4449 [Dactylellina haptotyla CBS 200.50]|uniref:Uncharacterized protein n=1 Tax=Dactylellina haptotyla (strain CBS 200.50) TaxID=1284197 RepID=S8AF10_DACHA|nr:hypothetical protein H072_4449 [Dactylellina haptotyla CBS 200.50]